MKKVLILALLTNLILNFPVGAEELSKHKVLKVIDGDTIYIDFNNNGIPEKDEKVRINGIDTFETKINPSLEWQMQNFNLTQKEALGLGYLGKEYAKKELLNKNVKAIYTAEIKFDKNNRRLMSIYYDNGKNYEQEILKAGLAVVFTKSNLAPELEKYRNQEKLEKNIKRAATLDLVLFNTKTGKYHNVDCEYAKLMGGAELIQEKDIKKAVGGSCCINIKPDIVKKKKMSEILSKLENNGIAIYFVDPLKNKKPINAPDSNPALALLALINNAKESIDFAIYGIGNQDEIFFALGEAQKRGVEIKCVTDVDMNFQNIYSDTFRLISLLKNVMVDFESTKQTEEMIRKNVYKDKINAPYLQNISFDVDNNRVDRSYVGKYGIRVQKGIMHNKFFIIDGKYVWTGSTNVSSGCMTYNANVSAVIKSPEIAKLYTKEFNQMYYDGKFHTYKSIITNNENITLSDGTKISVYFSPKNQVFDRAIVPLIEQAQTTIDIPMFFLTHKDTIQALLDANSRGVKIRIILDAVGAESAYSKHDILREASVPVKVENWGGKMHMKSMIVDNRAIIVASTNWTSTASQTNDENLLVIHNEKLATEFTSEFERLYNSIPNKWLNKNPKPEGWDSKNSRTDRVDNDHNGLTDKEDPNCKLFHKRNNTKGLTPNLENFN